MTNNKQQTAVEWLQNEIWEHIEWKPQLEKRAIVMKFEQAKEMDKDRMIQFAKQCLDKALDLDVRTAYSRVEQYYNKIYGGNQ